MIHAAEPPAITRRRWIAAGALALALHLGGAALGMIQRDHHGETAEDFGSLNAIEFAELPASAETDAQQEAAEHDAEETPPTPDLAERQSVKRDDDLPVEQAAPVKPDDPELLLAQEKTKEQKDEADENEQVTEASKPQEAQLSSLAAAPAEETPQLEDIREDAAASATGSTDVRRQALENWQRKLIAHLGRHKRYPQEARARALTGEVEIRFRLDRSGRVRNAELVRSSGHRLLDDEAVAMMARANPLPPPPAGASVEMEMTAPIRYRLK